MVAIGLAMSLAGFLYATTLLPGFDLGDTASFQTIVGEDVITPRAAYPLYFALGRVFVALFGIQSAGPAYALNAMSAAFGVIAVGLTCWIGIRLSKSVLPGLVTGLMFAGSYTFWSQAVIAEVYTLHLTLAAACTAALLWWTDRPSPGRLAVFFSLYALSFGNHLSMILLAPGFVLFLARTMPGGARGLLAPRIVALAAGIALLGTLQYTWNIHGLRVEDPEPRGLLETLRIFWFDTTKSDWRESLVGGVTVSRIGERFEMYWFDLRQQFGIGGIALAAAGIARLLWYRHPAGPMLLVNYFVAAAFAFGYNVGDSHVFFLTSHAIVALFMAPGAALILSRPASFRGEPPPVRARLAFAAAALVLLAVPLARIADTYPAVDRAHDRRPFELLDSLTHGIAVERTIFGTHLDWQTQNGLSYYARYHRPEVAWFRIVDVLPHLPVLVRDNLEIGRSITLTPEAASQVNGAFGNLFDVEEDSSAGRPSLDERLADMRKGDVYVLCVMEPLRDWPLDPLIAATAASRLGGTTMPAGLYSVVAGIVGEPPVRVSSDRPFRKRIGAHRVSLDVRIESWIPFDTIRRAGYGQVLANRHKVLTLERGLSVVGLTPEGRVKVVAYEGGLYAPSRRYIIEPGAKPPQPGTKQQASEPGT